MMDAKQALDLIMSYAKKEANRIDYFNGQRECNEALEEAIQILEKELQKDGA